MKELGKSISVRASSMEKALSNKEHGLFEKWKEYQYDWTTDRGRDWPRIGLERTAGPGDPRQFWQSKGFLLYSKSQFLLLESLSGNCMENGLGANRESGENSWKALAGNRLEIVVTQAVEVALEMERQSSVVDTLWR